MTFKRVIIYLIITIPIFSSCYYKLSKHLSQLNPTDYTYSFPINTVRNVIEKKFDSNKFYKLSYCAGQIVDSHDTLPGDKNNIYLNYGWMISSGRSEIYYSWWGHLKLYPLYHIILDSLSRNQTKIIIESNPKVKIGIGIDYNHGLPSNFMPYTVPVKPSTVEEYKILKLIGDSLGEKNMPNIVKPTNKG